MSNVHTKDGRAPAVVADEAYDRNAQRGQNRAGIDLAERASFDEFESGLPIEPAVADEREADEGAEIRARVHDRGHDVVADDD